VKEFKEIYQNKTGKNTDFETARKTAEGVVRLSDVMAKIDWKEKIEL
jgi:hypothetical protein